MTADQDDAKRDQMKEFHEKSLEFAEAEKERVAAAHEKHESEQVVFEEQGKELAADQDAEEAKKKTDVVAWRKREVARKAELLADKEKKAKLEAEEKAKHDKKEAFDEKKAEYMTSLHDAAIEKAKAEKAESEREQTRKRLLLQAEDDARKAKLQADNEERMGKQEMEKEMLQKKDALEREVREELAGIHSKEVQGKLRIDGDLRQGEMRTPASQVGERARLTQDAKMKSLNLEREASKARGDAQVKLTVGKRQLEMEVIRRKGDLERKTRQKHIEIESALAQKKAEVNKEYS
jgi:hypothetical protein